MTIRVKLDVMLAKEGMTLTELAEKVGITLANLSILKTNKARAVRFGTLDAICEALNCQPGDLLEYVEEDPPEAEEAEEADEDDVGAAERPASST